MGGQKVIIYQKVQVATLLQAGFTYESIRNQVGVSNGCISNVAKKEKIEVIIDTSSGSRSQKLGNIQRRSLFIEINGERLPKK